MSKWTKFKLGVIVFVSLLVLIVFFQNSAPTTFKILFFRPVGMPKSVMLLLMLLLGFVIGLTTAAFLRRGAKKKKDQEVEDEDEEEF